MDVPAVTLEVLRNSASYIRNTDSPPSTEQHLFSLSRLHRALSRIPACHFPSAFSFMAGEGENLRSVTFFGAASGFCCSA